MTYEDHARPLGLYVPAVRCDSTGHFVKIGSDTCDCGIERIALP